MNTAKRTLVTAAIAAATIAAIAQDRVSFKGSVITLGPAQEPVRIALIVDGTERELQLSPNGNFRFTAREGQRLSMRSSCPGFVTKEVEIDATNATERDRDSTVRFDVELEQQDVSGSLYHPAPTGAIAFAQGTGRLIVAYNNRIEQREPMLIAGAP